MENSADTDCGVCCLKEVRCFQPFKRLWWYTIFMSLVIISVASSYTYMSSVQTTTQAVFSFSATDVGIWYAMFEIGSILSNLFTSYFLAKKNIPRVLAVGLVFVVIGCLMHSLPHFFKDYGDKIQTSASTVDSTDLIAMTLCNSSASIASSFNLTTAENITLTTEAPVDGSFQHSSVMLVVYCIAAFLNGAGYAPVWSLGMTYIDDNNHDAHGSTKYLTVVMACYSFAPIIGFGSGSALLAVYVNFKDTYLSPDDEEWIGAWWLGYLIFGGLTLLLIPILVQFPKRMPAPSNQFELDSKVGSSDDNLNVGSVEGEDELRSPKGFFPALGRLLTNPVYVLEVIGSIFSIYYISGWLSLLPKFFEEHFYYSASMASIFVGVIPPVFGIISLSIGGCVVSKLKLTVPEYARFIFLAFLLGTIVLLPLPFLSCQQYPAQQPPANLSCLSDCGCDAKAFSPVCYNGVSYYSACASGCSGYHMTEDEDIVYTECICEQNVTMTKGSCVEEDCYISYIYVVIIILSSSFMMSCSPSAINLIFRVVEERDKSLALGLQSSLNSLLGWIPAPIIYGYLLDSTCNIWEYPDGTAENPDWLGYCLEYDNTEYRLRYTGMTIGMMAGATLFTGLSWLCTYLPRYKKTSDDTGDGSSDKS